MFQACNSPGGLIKFLRLGSNRGDLHSRGGKHRQPVFFCLDSVQQRNGFLRGVAGNRVSVSKWNSKQSDAVHIKGVGLNRFVVRRRLALKAN
jgi:hypothetical protein